MRFTLRVWRQKDAASPGRFETLEASDVSPDMSFPEMLDRVNEDLVARGLEPVAFDSDCREGICGACGIMVNGRAHGHTPGSTTCELRMRRFADGETLTLEPFRARPFSVIRDLAVDRGALEGILKAGGYVSVNAGSAPDAHAVLVGKEDADRAMDAAQCIGCGACVAACPNAAAMLFGSAKIAHLASLPQGRVEWARRARDMAAAMDEAGFGHCSRHGECEAACPKEIPLGNIARWNRHFLLASLFAPADRAEESAS